MKKLTVLAILLLAVIPARAEETLEGHFQPIVIDFEDGSHRLDFYLEKNDGSMVRLFIPSESSARSLLASTLIRVSGNPAADGFDLVSYVILDDTQAQAMARSAVTGTRRVAVVMVNFQDDTRTPYTKAQAESMMFGTVNDWFEDVSYGKVNITGDVYGWWTVPLTAKSDRCSIVSVWNEARKVATANGVSLDTYHHYYLVIPRQGCGWAGIAFLSSSLAMTDQYLDERVTTHELGHNLGLHHANSLDCGSSVLASPVDGSCANREYGDVYDAMGSNRPYHYSAAYKEKLGWLSTSELLTVTASGTYDLEPIALGASTLKGLKIPSLQDGKSVNFYFEYRRPLNQDSSITDSRVINGALMHINTNTSLAGVAGRSVLLDANPSTNGFGDAGLAVGESFTDQLGNKVTVISADAAKLRLQVDLDEDNDAGIVDFSGSVFGGSEPNPSQAVIWVERKVNSQGAISIPFTFRDGTAVAGSDYDGSAINLTFADGEMGLKSFNVPIIDDVDIESLETFTVIMGEPTNGARKGTITEATISIFDDDTVVGGERGVFEFANTIVNVQESGGAASLTIRYTPPAEGAVNSEGVSVRFATKDGTAIKNLDYTVVVGTVVFQGNVRETTFEIGVIDDTLAESLEEFTVNLQNPQGGDLGEKKTVTVRITDDDTDDNQAPVAQDGSASTDEELGKAITLVATDADGDALTYRVVAAPAHGTLSGAAPNLTYQPALNYHGPDSFTFVANDGQLDSQEATISLTILPVNDAPSAPDQSVTVIQNTPKAISLGATDIDGDSLTYRIIAAPTHGQLSGALPTPTYTPDPGYTGTDSFVFEAADASTNDTGTVSLSVVVNNTPPTVSISNPAEGQIVSPGPLSVSVEASGPQTIARVLLYLDNQPVADMASAPYNTTLDAAALASGPHELRAVAMDSGGNSSSDTTTFVLQRFSGQAETLRNVFNPEQGEAASFRIPGQTSADVRIFDRLGVEIRRMNVPSDGSEVNVTWDGRNDDGSQVASGLYRMRISVGSTVHKKNVVVVK